MKLALTCFVVACSTLAAQSEESLVSRVRTFHEFTSYEQRCEGTCYSQRNGATTATTRNRPCSVYTYCAVSCDDPSRPQVLCRPQP